MRTLLSLLVVAVGVALTPAAQAAPRILATGDSMIEPLDQQLARQLKPAAVPADARVGTGISKTQELDWVKHADRQVRRYRQKATVMWIGTNDGWRMETPSGREVGCCRSSWVQEYARRVAAMMRSYTRTPGSRVYWLTLPAPRRESMKRFFAAVNAGLRLAAEKAGPAVRLLDMGKVFTPGDRYRRTLRYRGRTVVVRSGDGVHLTPAGAAIAAEVVVRHMRADGVVR